MSRPRSLSGHRLQGSKLVRLAYLDETGITKRDPVVAVAGVIIHGDTQLAPLDAHLEMLVKKHIPPENRDGFFFHAAEIYGRGSKDSIFRDVNTWPEERRYAILDDLVAIPKAFGIPVPISLINREFFNQVMCPNRPDEEQLTASHALALIYCEAAVDGWMSKNTKDEITYITVENNDYIRKIAKLQHNIFRDRSKMDLGGYGDHDFFPLKHIKDGLQFAYKDDSKILQLADACAWACRRKAIGALNSARFYNPMRDCVGPIFRFPANFCTL